MGELTTTPERKASPRLITTNLPVPPYQFKPWTNPVSSIPQSYVSAAQALFDAGLADPRGCEYRELSIGFGEPRAGDAGVIPVRGWLIPGKGAQRYAVCWNGLVYPVAEIGPPADFRHDAQLIAEQGAGAVSWRMAGMEAFLAAPPSLSPIKGCVLLRLGESKLAYELWAGGQEKTKHMFDGAFGATNQQPRETVELKVDAADPFAAWAGDWTWNMFERAVCALMRGDDKLALVDCRRLIAAEPVIEREAVRRGVPLPYSFSMDRPQGTNRIIDFSGQALMLAENAAKRVVRSESPALSMAGASALTNKMERIAALIRQLDESRNMQMGQAGGLWPWSFAEPVASLIKEGGDAVEPLLIRLETDADASLTRSISFGRDFHRARHFHPVSEPIIEALHSILQCQDFGVWATSAEMAAAGTNQSRITAARARAYWRKFGVVPLEERWYMTLKDDNAGQDAWTDALSAIVSSSASTPALVNWPMSGKADGDTPAPLRGESLRSKSNPTVTELILKRATTWIPRNKGNTFELSDRVNYVHAVSLWDCRAALPLVNKQLAQCFEIFEHQSPYDCATAADGVMRFTEQRITAEEQDALKDYAAWLTRMKPEAFKYCPGNVFEPFWKYPTHPALAGLAGKIFVPDSYLLRGVLDRTNGLQSFTIKNCGADLLSVPQFRQLVVEALHDKTILGKATIGTNGWISTSNGMGWLGSAPTSDTPCKVGEETSFRICDYIASTLSKWEGMPDIQVYWFEPAKDQAVAACEKAFERIGPRIREARLKKGSE
jgi:hypothetical protein